MILAIIILSVLSAEDVSQTVSRLVNTFIPTPREDVLEGNKEIFIQSTGASLVPGTTNTFSLSPDEALNIPTGPFLRRALYLRFKNPGSATGAFGHILYIDHESFQFVSEGLFAQPWMTVAFVSDVNDAGKRKIFLGNGEYLGFKAYVKNGGVITITNKGQTAI